MPGFKYIGNTALALVEQGFEVPFGYEEAIGFMFGSYIRDKDGVAATVCVSHPSNLRFSQLTSPTGFIRRTRRVFAQLWSDCEILSARAV
jgi:hypothetical protein